MLERVKPNLALFTVSVMYGLNFVIAKDVMPDYIKPFGFIFYRALGGLVFFWVIGTTIKNKAIQKKDFLKFLACGFFGVAANQLMFFYGLNLTSSVNASIIITMVPVLILVTSSVLLKLSLSLGKVLGIALGLAGALLLILYKPNVSFSGGSLVGDLFVFLNALSYSIYIVLATPLMKKYPPVLVAKWMFLFGTIYIVPFSYTEILDVDWSSFQSYTWFAVGFVVFGATCLTYMLNLYGVKKLGPNVTASYVYLQPIVATVFSVFRGEEGLNGIKLLAAGLIFVGVYLVNKYKSKNI